jgi:dimethylamine/trimethylamine dehydrogenase
MSRTSMPCNPHYEILFEPMRIGPVTAPNRFYQVPHASGMTNALPRVRAAFREAKAEGGWGVMRRYRSQHYGTTTTSGRMR